MNSIRFYVFRALDNAVENGYADDCDGTGRSVYDGTDAGLEAIAIDLGTDDADLEGLEPEVLVPIIREWQASRRPR